jgi:hypothetical protein
VDQAEARAICAGCPAAVPCLDGAVRRNEQYGIWAGQLAPFGRLATGRALRAGDPLAYQAAITAAIERPERPAGICQRCGDPTPATVVIDNNSPGATCGIATTYNKGCRCDRCRATKRPVPGPVTRTYRPRARLREAG